jgi:uncharacterized integral membrane protein
MTQPDSAEGSSWRPLTSPQTPPDRRGLGLRTGIVGLVVAGALLLALVVQNSDDVAFHLLWIDASLPLSAIVLGSALIAVVIDEAVGLVWRRRRRRQLDLEDRLG